MKKQEFEKLVGILVTEAEFEWANNIYMLTDEITKEYFAEQFSRLNLIALVRNLVILSDDLDRKDKECKALQAKLTMIKTLI